MVALLMAADSDPALADTMPSWDKAATLVVKTNDKGEVVQILAPRE